ncbi:hypothetical protein BDZ91DRAFT_791904 [Kalaharituber pfeilii]|nr:hypothetical protein BDZ91DRAFT_791904 [Kalaharituber pfeilii]
MGLFGLYTFLIILLVVLPPYQKYLLQNSIVNIHTWHQENHAATPIHWVLPKKAQVPLPSLAISLTSIEASPTTNIHLFASYKWVTEGDIYNVILDSGNNIIFSATCSWLEIPANHPVLRTGTYTMTEPLTLASSPRRILIQFSEPFIKKAKVALFLNGMDFDKRYNPRVNIHAVDETANGFTLILEAWWDTIVQSLGVTWVAYPEGTPGVTSGVVCTGSLRPWMAPQHYNAWYQSFVGEVAFLRTPRIFLGISSLDFLAGANLRVVAEVVNGPETNQYGFLWRANSWLDSVMYSTCMGYLAFDPEL